MASVKQFLVYSILTLSLLAQNKNESAAYNLLEKSKQASLRKDWDSVLTFGYKADSLFRMTKNFRGLIQITILNNTAWIEKNEFNKVISSSDSMLRITKGPFPKEDSLTVKLMTLKGFATKKKGDFAKALTVFQSALPLQIKLTGENSLQTASILTQIGNVFIALGKYDTALIHLKKALAIRNKAGDISGEWIITMNDIGQTYHLLGDEQKAYDYYYQALIKGEKVISRREYSALHNNIATTYMLRGDYEQALDWFFRSLAIKLETGENDLGNVAVNYNNIAMSYRFLEKYEEALPYSEKSKEFFLKAYGEEHPNTGSAIHNIGRIYYDIKDYSHALEFYKYGGSIWEKKLGPNHPNVSHSKYSIGMVYLGVKQYDSALVYLNASLTQRLKIWPGKHPKKAEPYEALALVFRDQGKWDDALKALQLALIQWSENFNDTSVFSDLSMNSILSEQAVLPLLDEKASVFFEKFRFEKNPLFLKKSMALFDSCSTLITRLRNSYKAQDSKFFLSKKAHAIYEHAIKTAIESYRLSGQSNDLEKALGYVEQSKAAVLTQSLYESHARQFGGIPDSLSDLEEQFRIQLTSLENRILKQRERSSGSDSSAMVSLQKEYFLKKADYEKFQNLLESTYIDYYKLKYSDPVFSVKKLQQRLESQTVCLNYFVGEDSLYTFLIKKEEICIYVTDVDSSFTNHNETLFKSIKKIDGENYLKSSRVVYQKLITPMEPALKGVTSLVIIPDGKLYYTPFEALVSPSREREFHRQKYLVQKFDIRYHYSATLFCESKAAHTTPEFDFLGYAPIFPDSVKTASSPFIDSLLWSVSREVSVDGKKFSYLPGTEKEITTIVRFFLDQKKQAKGFYYNEASESSLKSMASKTRILHVATHGLMNESTPKLSGIILTVPDTTTLIDDGILYASETYNLRLNADLVVLSSCESGIGKLQKGEGLMAIGRGFLFSGANNLLYSLWKVDDRSTTMMMENFYSQILNQSSYANALRQAKLKMIENPKTAFPKNWAGFVIFGK